jgi:hypothetical protein
MALKIKIKLGGMTDITINNGPRGTISTAIRISVVHREEPNFMSY